MWFCLWALSSGSLSLSPSPSCICLRAEGIVSQTSKGWHVTSYSVKIGLHYQISLENDGSKLHRFFISGPVKAFTIFTKVYYDSLRRSSRMKSIDHETLFPNNALLALWKRVLQVLKKLKIQLPCDQANPLLGILLKRMKNKD